VEESRKNLNAQFIPGARNINVLNLTDNAVRDAFSAPEFSYWLRPENVIPGEGLKP
jgi:hypothetical protein